MCGILGIAVAGERRPRVTLPQLEAMRDVLQRRGPDGAGAQDLGNVMLAHRRLAVIDPGPEGAQPMASADGRWTLVYNGELYNDAEVRRALVEEGYDPRGFRGRGDTATVLAALEHWGPAALVHLRGMFALGAHDARERRLLLARDPLGVKPLYWWCDGRELVFASDPRAILAHPSITAEPDLEGISAYLSTVRSTCGERTLFAGVNALAPGTRLELDVSPAARRGLQPRVRPYHAARPVDPTLGPEEATERLRAALEDSVRRQLVSDVPLCSLLSGGLDSAVLTAVAGTLRPGLRTYAAGTPCDGERGDLEHARELADFLGTEHAEATVDARRFLDDWRWMVAEGGLPLSTPNEVAIHAVAERLAEDGCKVTLSGEGADELLAGYEGVLRAAQGFEEGGPSPLSGGRFQLEAGAWISPAAKHEILREGVWVALADDAFLTGTYEGLFDRCRAEAGDWADPLDAHLRFLRRVNLTGLLERLDRATMLASVEGRVPFADSVVLDLCESMPLVNKLGPREDHGSRTGGGLAVAAAPRTKLVLRRAFADRLPRTTLERPKASFPLPFQGWIAPMGALLQRSPFAQALFTREALEKVGDDPQGLWTLAWPMVNLALWGDRWFS